MFDPDKAPKAARILQMHAAGYSAAEIIASTGYNKGYTRNIITRFAERSAVDQQERIIEMLTEVLLLLRTLSKQPKSIIERRVQEALEAERTAMQEQILRTPC